MKQTFQRPPLRLASRRIAIQPLSRAHLGAVQDLLRQDGMAGAWPHLTVKDTQAEFEQRVWQTSSLQFAVVKRHTEIVVGLLQGVNIDDRNRTIAITAVISPDLWRQGWPFEGIVLFVNFLFERKGFRKVYFQMPASNILRIGSAMERWLTKEVVLRQHTRNGDGYEDWCIFSLFADQWDPDIVDLISPRS